MSRWISVADRLPDGSTIVLLWADCGSGACGVEMGWFRGEGEYYWQSVETAPQDEPIFFREDQVTHWMPLPDAPEAK